MFWFSGFVCLSVQGNKHTHFPILEERTKALPRRDKMEKEVAALQKKWQPLRRGYNSIRRRGGRHPPLPGPRQTVSQDTTLDGTAVQPVLKTTHVAQACELAPTEPRALGHEAKEKENLCKNQEEGGGPQGSKLWSSPSHRLPLSSILFPDHSST